MLVGCWGTQQLNQWMATARGGEVKSETVGAEAIARASESGGRGGAIPESMHQYAHQYASVQVSPVFRTVAILTCAQKYTRALK